MMIERLLARSSAKPASSIPRSADSGPVSPDRAQTPRAQSSSIHDPRSLLDRAIECLADSLNLGKTYRACCLNSNLALLCEKPEEWKKNPDNYLMLEHLRMGLFDDAGFDAILKEKLSTFSEQSLSEVYQALNDVVQANSSLSTPIHGESTAATKLKSRVIDTGLKKAVTRIVKDFDKADLENSDKKYIVAVQLRDMIQRCPDIKEAVIVNALSEQLVPILTSEKNDKACSKTGGKAGTRVHSVNLEDTFATTKTTTATPADKPNSIRDKDFKCAEDIFTQAMEIAVPKAEAEAQAKARQEEKLRQDQQALASAEEKKAKFLCRADLKKAVGECFQKYYRSIDSSRFGSTEAKDAVETLFSELAILELEWMKKEDFGYFLNEIKRKAEEKETGRAGGLLQKMSRTSSGFKRNDDDMQFLKFNELESIKWVLCTADASRKEFQQNRPKQTKRPS